MDNFSLNGNKLCSKNPPNMKITNISKTPTGDIMFCAEPNSSIGGKRRKTKKRKTKRRKTTIKQYFQKLMKNFF